MCLFYMICHVYLLVDLLVYMHFYAQTQYPYIIFLMCACLEGWFTCYQQFGVSKGPAQRLQETTGHSALPLRLLGSENSGKPRKPKSQRCLGDEKWSAWRFSSHVILPCFLWLRAYGFRKQIYWPFWVWQQWFSRADPSMAIFLCSKVPKVSAKGSATTSRRKALRFTQRRQSIKQKKRFDVQDGIIRSSEHCW